MSGSPGTSRGNNRVPLIYSGTPPAEAVVACAAAGAGTMAQAGVVPTSSRRLFLWLRYNAAAIGGYPAIQVWGCAVPTAPVSTSAEWRMLSVWDGSPTYAAMAGAQPAGAPPGTATQTMARIQNAPIEICTRAALNAADVIPLAVPPIDVSGCRFLQFIYREAGVVGTPGSLLVHYSFGTG